MLLDISAAKKAKTKTLPSSGYRKLRLLPDGRTEVETRRGRQYYYVYDCLECGHECLDFVDRRNSSICFVCLEEQSKRKETARREDLRRALIAKKRAQYEAGNSPRQRRSAIIMLAAPKWRDRKKIREVYKLARRLSEETGVKHHVDHIYPLQSIICCGLHVHQNLRVLTASENCSKNAAFPFDQSPALVGVEARELGRELRAMARAAGVVWGERVNNRRQTSIASEKH